MNSPHRVKRSESPTSRTYDVIDADGQVLERFTLWNDYLDPTYRDCALKLVRDGNGKERLLLEEKILGSTAGFGGIGGVGAQHAAPARTHAVTLSRRILIAIIAAMPMRAFASGARLAAFLDSTGIDQLWRPGFK
jgi:hypothetical protein